MPIKSKNVHPSWFMGQIPRRYNAQSDAGTISRKKQTGHQHLNQRKEKKPARLYIGPDGNIHQDHN